MQHEHETEQLGHSGIKVTIGIYGHWIFAANRQAVNPLRGPAASVQILKIRTMGAPKKKAGSYLPATLPKTNGADETRTRDLRRDRTDSSKRYQCFQ